MTPISDEEIVQMFVENDDNKDGYFDIIEFRKLIDRYIQGDYSTN
jgi:Ca2+-binding EF-hand superfamily protein